MQKIIVYERYPVPGVVEGQRGEATQNLVRRAQEDDGIAGKIDKKG